MDIVCKLLENEEVICEGITYAIKEEHASPGSFLFWLYLFLSIGCVLCAGIASGLTIGLLSMDLLSLEILTRSGTPTQQKHAKKLIPLVSNQHLLLVTLLLSNAIVMEALPIFLDRISTPVAAVIISVTAVLIFGEIIPQALCKRFGLAIGSNLYWLVRFLMFIFFPVAYPIAKILDKLLGHNGINRFQRKELAELVEMHGQAHQGPLTIDETTVIIGALKLKNKTAINCMTPLEKVFMLDTETDINLELIKKVKGVGHSRIPIFEGEKSNVKGILLTKSFLAFDLSRDLKIKDLELREMPSVFPSAELYDLLNQFQEGKSHMYLVRDVDSKSVIGVVTLEDVIEELIQEEILDESDLAEEYQMKMQKARMKALKYSKGTGVSSPNVRYESHENLHMVPLEDDKQENSFL